MRLLPLLAVLLAAAPQADDAATITGQVRIKGEVPRRRKIPTNADPKCAALHGGDSILSDDFVADAAGNVQWAFVTIKRGLGDRAFELPKAPVVVEQKGCRFEPHVLSVRVGQELLFRNQDPLMHIVHVVPGANREFGFSQAKVGEERPKVFTAKETIRLFCDVHPWMVAWIHVVDHPFTAVTGPDGKFELKGLPPGKYTLEVWHESYKPVAQEIEVTAGKAASIAVELTERREQR